MTLASHLAERISAALESSAPRVLLVTGAPGSGKTFLLAESLRKRAGVHYVADGLTDDGHREVFSGLVGELLAADVVGDEGWTTLLRLALRSPADYLVIDGVGSVVRANKGFLRALGSAWRDAARRGPAPALILVDRDRTTLARVNDRGSAFRDPMENVTGAPDPGVWLALGPVPYAHWPGSSLAPLERLRTAAVFGGRPSVMRHVDESNPLELNIRALTLDPDGALWDEPLRSWQAELRHAGRYGAVCAALSGGARYWAEIADLMGEGTSASGVGPYMKRLIALGRVVAESSLDAVRGGRGQRYRLVGAFDAFWWSTVLPLRSRLASRSLTPEAAWSRISGTALSEHLRRRFPMLCRDFLETRSQELLGGTARSAGALWGQGFDIPVAGVLMNGAVVYGTCHAGPSPMTDVALDRLEEHMKATRFGFGREARIRVLFSLSGFSEALVLRASRNPMVRLIGPSEMLGE